MKTLKQKIQDFTLRRGQYADCGLKVDYGMWLAEQSGYSWMFVTYGIGLLYRKNQLPRELWIAYLERKFAKTKVTLQKKLGVRPDGWSDKIIRD